MPPHYPEPCWSLSPKPEIVLPASWTLWPVAAVAAHAVVVAVALQISGSCLFPCLCICLRACMHDRACVFVCLLASCLLLVAVAAAAAHATAADAAAEVGFSGLLLRNLN